VMAALYLRPGRFVSQAIIAIPASAPDAVGAVNIWPRYRPVNLVASQAVILMKAPGVLDKVLSASRTGSLPILDADRSALLTRIQADVIKGDDSLIKLTVRGNSAAEAQATANQLIDAWLQTQLPSPRQLAELAKWRAHAQSLLTTAQALLDGPKGSLSSAAGLGELLDRYFAQLMDIDRAIAGPGRELVVQGPTLPEAPQDVPYAVTFIQTALATAIFLIMGILIRLFFIVEGRDPDKARKLGQVRASLGRHPDGVSPTDR
jgi:hypothetical protein